MSLQENKIIRDSNGNIVFEATKQKRLINFLIDTPIWFFLLYLLGYLAREFESIENIFIGFMWLLMLGAYSIISEFFFKKTIGKFLTKTKVVFKQDVKPELG